MDWSGRMTRLLKWLITSQTWSVQPCVRPLDAVHMTAGNFKVR
jgi:hypothetical protein